MAQGATANQPIRLIPFTNAAYEHVETIHSMTVTPTAQRQVIGPIDIPSYGYLRNEYIVMTTITPGSGGTPVLRQDGPSGLIDDVMMSDVNGGPLVYPLSGFGLMWTNILTGPTYLADPRRWPEWKNDPQAPGFAVRVPHEITAFDGYGSLANQDSSSNYKLTLTIPAINEIWSTPPTVAPTFRLEIWGESWSVPTPADMLGNPQAQAPPQLGSARYISNNVQTVSAGLNTIPNKRTGNLIESILLIGRDESGVRTNSVLPDPFSFKWDNRDILQQVSMSYLRSVLKQATDPVELDVGVVALSFNKATLNRAGNGPLRLLMPTVQSTRQEFTGTAAAKGTLEIVTIDQSVTEIDAADRYVLENAGGFHPEVGVQV